MTDAPRFVCLSCMYYESGGGYAGVGFPPAPDRTAKALDELASVTERSRKYLILKALEAYLAEYADYQVALARLRDEDDPVVSAAELRKRLGDKD